MEIKPGTPSVVITSVFKENQEIIKNIIGQNSLILKAMLAPALPVFITGKIEEKDE